MSAFDLTFLSILRVKGQEFPALPGLLAQNPPQKPARGREQDRLIVFLTLTGNSNNSPEDYIDIVKKLSDSFYSTPGSLTSALKTAVSDLNTSLVDNNMKSTGKGLYCNANLVLCTLRGNSMYVVQAGPTHVYHLGAENRHLYDPELAGKGLGINQAARMYFSQVTLGSGDRLLLCSALPTNWDKSLTESRGSASLEITRRRLLAITESDVSAVLMLAAEGNGGMNILNAQPDVSINSARFAAPASLQKPMEHPDYPAANPVEVPEPVLEPIKPVAAPRLSQARQNTEPAELPKTVPLAEVESRAVPLPEINSVGEDTGIDKPFARTPVSIPGVNRDAILENLQSAAGFLAGLIQSGRAFSQKASTWLEKTIPSLLPDTYEEQPLSVLSRNLAIFFAVATPILLLVVARVVYYQLGFEAQHALYYTRAQDSAKQAMAEASPPAARVEWQATLDWLDKADQFQSVADPESVKFRLEAQSALDQLDKVVRVDFAPAFDSPPGKSVHVARITATDTEVYFLDAVTGSVSRGVFNGRNFDIDKSFHCDPGTYNDKIIVGKLVDIQALPKNGSTNNTTLLGIDNAGNVLYCMPGQLPKSATLQPPGPGWKDITSIVYDQGTLYVLDAPARGVWFYQQDDQALTFSGQPKIFFGEQVPVMLEQATGMAVNGNDLYLLHKDGHLATCTFSPDSSAPTRCNDPALYIDTRPGFQGGMNLTDGVFSQIAFTSAPNPAVALLEPFSQSIFRFSPRALELQNQVKINEAKANPFPKETPITAMAFSPNKILFVYVDGQMYFSVNAP